MRIILAIIFLFVLNLGTAQIFPDQLGWAPDSSSLWYLSIDTTSSSYFYGRGKWRQFTAGGTDDQTIDTLQLTGTTLEISLESDAEPLQTVDLSSLQDGTGTDDQTIDVFNISTGGGGGTISLSLENDGQASQTIDIEESVEDVMNAAIIGGTDISTTYDDPLGTITIDYTGTGDGNGIFTSSNDGATVSNDFNVTVTGHFGFDLSSGDEMRFTSSTVGGPDIHMFNSTTGSIAFADGFAISINSNGEPYFWNAENTPLEFYTNATQRMDIEADGDVKFYQDIELDGHIIDINGSTGTNGQVLSRVTSGVDWIDSGGSYWSEGSGAAAGDIYMSLSNADVGIGTNSTEDPRGQLDIEDPTLDVFMTSTTSGATDLYLEGEAGGIEDGSRINFRNIDIDINSGNVYPMATIKAYKNHATSITGNELRFEVDYNTTGSDDDLMIMKARQSGTSNGSIWIDGGIVFDQITNYNSNTTLDSGDFICVKTSTGNITYTLPELTAADGYTYIVVNDGITGSITVQRSGSDVIDAGLTSISLAIGESIIIIGVGANQWVTFD